MKHRVLGSLQLAPSLLGFALLDVVIGSSQCSVGHTDPDELGPLIVGGSQAGTCMGVGSLRVATSKERDQGAYNFTSDTMNITLCYDLCFDNRTFYMGLQGVNCRCFDIFTDLKMEKPVCSVPCAGNTTEMCGGTLEQTYSVFVIHTHLRQYPSVPCGPPPEIKHASEMCADSPGDIGCNLTCSVGYRLVSNTLSCDTTRGKWIGHAECAPVHCFAPPSILSALSVCTSASPTSDEGACEVTCLPGFQLVTNTLNCSAAMDPRVEEGIFTGSAVCKQISCGQPPVDPAASHSKVEVLYPDSVTFTCPTGHSRLGVKRYHMQCMADGTFSNSTEKCEPVPCGPLPSIRNAVRVNGERNTSDAGLTFPEFATFECDEGFSPDGATGLSLIDVVCLPDGTYDAPLCQRITCGPPLVWSFSSIIRVNGDNPSLQPAVLREDVLYDSSVQYSCNEGYKTNGGVEFSFAAKCSSSGGFRGMQDCKPISCGVPDVAPHTSVVETEVWFDAPVVVLCDEGYTTTGMSSGITSYQVTCLANGTFQRVKGCQPVDCGRLPTGMKMAKVMDPPATLRFPESVEYTCEPGYSTDRTVLPGSAVFSVTCSASGQYSNVRDCLNIDDCASVSCGPFGRCIDELRNYSCQCTSGYEVIVDPETNAPTCGNIDDCGPEACGRGGVCQDLVNDYTCECDAGFELFISESEKVCTPIPCSELPTLTHATIENDKAVFGDVVVGVCDNGFTADGMPNGQGRFQIECLASGQFSEPLACRPVICKSPQQKKTVELVSGPAGDTFVFGEIARYDCLEGHTIDETPSGNTSFERQCTETGAFTAGQDCLPVSCGQPLPLPSAVAAFPNLPSSFGDEIQWRCAEGFALNPLQPNTVTFSLKCGADGLFSSMEGTCEPVACKLSPVPFAKSNVDLTGSVSFPAVVLFTCFDGYTVTGGPDGYGGFRASCGAGGTMQNMLECRKISCGVLGDVVHASSTHAKTREMFFDDKAEFVCDPGYGAAEELTHLQLVTPRDNQPIRTSFEVACLASGILTQPFTCQNIDDCVDNTCGVHGTCVDGVQEYSCNCEVGFEPTKSLDQQTGKQHVRCGNIDDCPPGVCGSHGDCVDLIHSYTCKCNQGYEVVADGDGSTCNPKPCADVVNPIDHSDLKEQRHLVYPESLLVKCEHGYTVDASTVQDANKQFHISCNANGVLTPTAACQPIACGHAPQISHVSEGPQLSSRYVFGEQATYTCMDGFRILGGESTLTLQCDASGTFKPADISLRTCDPVTCGTVPDLAFATKVMSQAVFPNTVTYTCKAGYVVDGTADGREIKRHCLATGEFSAPFAGEIANALCKKRSCGEPPVVTNANRAGGDVMAGDVVRYTCRDGYSVDGMNTGLRTWVLSCDASGDFSRRSRYSCTQIMIEMHGIVTNAINNKPVSSAEVHFPDQSTHTDGLGKFSHRVPVGQTHVVVKKSGFTEADHDLSPITAEENHVVISPILPPSGWRIVLTWKQEPRDLDSHLFFGAAQKCHLYYRYRSVPCGSNRVATLDTDARYGIGPETVTVQNAQSCTSSCDLVYKVYKYAPGGAYSRQCGAVVTVYNGDSVKGVYKFDEGDGHIEDRWWAVVRINPHSGTVSECGSVACPA